MLRKVIRLLFGLMCGYLVVNWIPLKIPFHPADFFAEFILNPLEFLAGTMALVFGMFAIGNLIRDGIIAAGNTLKGRNGFVSDIILGIGSVGCYFLLLPIGKWQASVFYCFCLLYGMISLSPLPKEEK